MSATKLTVNLKGVPQTLLLPLVGRALYSKESYSPIHDQRAIDIADALSYDFKSLLDQLPKRATLWWIARAYHFDQAIKQFLQKNPQGTVVNLGAGLETAFFRVDNGSCQWIDLDLPEVIELRQQLIPTQARVTSISKSMTDLSWMTEVKKHGEPVFFFARDASAINAQVFFSMMIDP